MKLKYSNSCLLPESSLCYADNSSEGDSLVTEIEIDLSTHNAFEIKINETKNILNIKIHGSFEASEFFNYIYLADKFRDIEERL